MNISRIFDIFPHQLAHCPQTTALAVKDATNKKWITYTTQDVIDCYQALSSAMLQIGLQKGDAIGIIANNNCPEWHFIDFAAQQIGLIVVPVYPTITLNEYEFIFNHAEIKVCFVSDKKLFQKVVAIKSKVPSLQEIISFFPLPQCRHLNDLMALGKQQAKTDEIKTISDTIKTTDLATIIYTSGTTGLPKGVMLSHQNILANVSGVLQAVALNGDDRALSFLPLSHVFERTVTYSFMVAGVNISYSNIVQIGSNIRAVKPTYFTAVPRILEKTFERIEKKGGQLTGIKKSLFNWAIALAEQYDAKGQHSWWYKQRLALAHRLVFGEIRKQLGGELKGIVVGAAALPQRLAKIFNAAGIPIAEGYGLTEASPVIATNRFKAGTNYIGTVGIPLHNVEVKISESDGEILAKGPSIMMGYYKRADLTAKVINKDGWLHTGDVGEMVDDKFLKITDRKKLLFKLTNGKYVAPQPLENKLRESSFIEQVMITGAGQKYPVAVIVPSFEILKEYNKKEALQINESELNTHPKIRAHYKQIINHYNKQFSSFEQIRNFTLLPRPWTIENGELTPTLKLKRKNIVENWQAAIEELFE